VIEARGLTKTYRVPLKQPGLAGSLRGLFRREHREVHAVREVDLRVEAGERVGFLGPNGAGKTTTLKMLSGLLHPTAGECRVLGFRPQDRDRRFLESITLVMGQKRQLIWDLPATETFELNRALFGLDPVEYRRTLDELVSELELAPFLDQPVRNLSLGQRMRCELASALLHRPKVLFLDEPTIGLDVAVQLVLRRFVRGWNERHGATILLTSHDMRDVAALAQRIVLIDHGQIRFDGPLSDFTRRYGSGRRLLVRAEASALAGLPFQAAPDGRMMANLPASEVNGLLAEVLRRLPEAELTVEDPPLEEVLATAFAEKSS
jgi:ABC-2 type transport system ATP-binding protein